MICNDYDIYIYIGDPLYIYIYTYNPYNDIQYVILYNMYIYI